MGQQTDRADQTEKADHPDRRGERPPARWRRIATLLILPAAYGLSVMMDVQNGMPLSKSLIGSAVPAGLISGTLIIAIGRQSRLQRTAPPNDQ